MATTPFPLFPFPASAQATVQSSSYCGCRRIDLFGAWDCDHWILTVFPDATWEDIVADPLTYLNSQWYPGAGGGVPFQPWPKYEFKLGRPF